MFAGIVCGSTSGISLVSKLALPSTILSLMFWKDWSVKSRPVSISINLPSVYCSGLNLLKNLFSALGVLPIYFLGMYTALASNSSSCCLCISFLLALRSAAVFPNSVEVSIGCSVTDTSSSVVSSGPTFTCSSRSSGDIDDITSS